MNESIFMNISEMHTDISIPRVVMGVLPRAQVVDGYHFADWKPVN
jgi:hypothetical protein